MEKKLSRLTTQQRFDLVAYVDGELSDADTARIEKLLAGNAVARTEVESLIATYELLSNLPRPRAQGDFTERTMAVARLNDAPSDLTESTTSRRARAAIRTLTLMAATVVAGLAGYAATRFYLPQPHDDLVRDLPVIRQLDKFAEVGQIDFLDRLAADQDLMRDLKGEPSGVQPTPPR